MRRLHLVLAAAVLLGAPACSERISSVGAAPEVTTPPPPGPRVADGALPPGPCATPWTGTSLKLAPAVVGLRRPVFLTAPPKDPRLFVVEQDGFVRVVKDGVVLPPLGCQCGCQRDALHN